MQFQSQESDTIAQKNVTAIKSLESSNEELKKSLKAKETELKAVSENYDKVKKHMQSLRENFNSATNSIRQYEEQCNNFADEKIKFIQDLKDAHASIEEKRRQVSDLKQEVSHTKIRLSEVEYENVTLQVKHKEITEHQAKMDKQRITDGDELVNKHKLISLLEKIHIQVFPSNQSRKHSNEEKLFDLQTEIERMRESLVEYEEHTRVFSNTFEWILKGQKGKKNDFKEQVADVNQTVETFVASKADADEMIKENQELKLIIDTKKQEIDGLVHDSETLRQTIKSYDEAAKQQSDNIEKLRVTLEQSVIENKSLEKTNNELEVELLASKKASSDQSNQLSNLIASHSSQLDQLNLEKGSLSKENIILKQEHQEIEQEKKVKEEVYQKSIDNSQQKITVLEEKIEELKNIHNREAGDLKNQIETRDALVSDLRKEDDALKAKLIDANKTKDELSHEIKTKELQVAELTKKHEEEQLTCSKLQNTLLKEQENIQNLIKTSEEDRIQLKDDLVQIQQDKEKKILKFQDVIAQKNSEIKTLTSELETINSKLKGSIDEINTKQQECDSISKQLGERDLKIVEAENKTNELENRTSKN